MSPHLGNYIATVRIPADVAVRVEQSGRDPDHYNVWAEPSDLLGWVAYVEPFEPLH